MLAVSRFVLRHKLAVVIFWLVVLAAGGAASAKLPGRLSAQFALPGAAGYQVLGGAGDGDRAVVSHPAAGNNGS
jgi:uncharacterized membrane protein YdfJ with MMPL/SSD domain